MGAFTIEKRSYRIKPERKALVNIYCEAFPGDGWMLFKRLAKETDASIVTRIKNEMAKHRKARKVAPPRTLIRLAPSALGEFHPRSVRALRRMKLMLPEPPGRHRHLHRRVLRRRSGATTSRRRRRWRPRRRPRS
jgi:hypothetical protein